MDTQMLVYLASIVDNIKIFTIVFGIICFMVVMIVSMANYEDKFSFVHRTGWKIGAGFIIFFGFMLCLATAIIPSGDDLYKIAGVNGQQKGMIDVQGKILQGGIK